MNVKNFQPDKFGHNNNEHILSTQHGAGTTPHDVHALTPVILTATCPHPTFNKKTEVQAGSALPSHLASEWGSWAGNMRGLAPEATPLRARLPGFPEIQTSMNLRAHNLCPRLLTGEKSETT